MLPCLTTHYMLRQDRMASFTHRASSIFLF
uniref:Uncharacterized protein n=1 Tax=Arundo donax TaxID=35708 RepID=A0A0A9GGZ9_ARUDO